MSQQNDFSFLTDQVDPTQPGGILPTQPVQQPQADFSFLSDKPNPVKDAAVGNIRNVQEVGLRPDQVAEARSLSKRTGIPHGVVQEDMDTARILDTMNGITTSLDDAPGTAAFLANPDNAALAWDDTEGLSTIEKLKRGMGNLGVVKAYKAGDYQTNVLGPMYNRQMYNVLTTGAEDPELARAIHEKELFQPEEPQRDGALDTVLYASANQIPIWTNLMLANLRGTMEGSIAGAGAAAVGGPATLPLAPATAAAGAAAMRDVRSTEAAFNLEANSAYGELRAITDENGQAIDPRIAAVGAQAVGAVNAYLEHLGFKSFLSFVPGGYKAVSQAIRSSAKEALKSEPVRAAIGAVVKDYVKMAATEGVTEMAQEATNIVVGEIGKRVSESLQGTFFDKFDWGAAASRIGSAGAEGAAASLGLGAGPAVVHTTMGVRKAQQAVEFRDGQKQINDAVHATQTMQRDPEVMREFLHIAGLGEEAYIAPEGVESLATSNPDLLQRLGLSPEQVAVAAEGGQALRVNTALLHTALSQDEFNQIVDDIKPSPGAMSAREGASMGPAEVVAAIDAAASDGFAAVQEVSRIREQLRTANDALGVYKTGEELEDTVDLMVRAARRLTAVDGSVPLLKNLQILADAGDAVIGGQQTELQQSAATAGVDTANAAQIAEAQRMWAEMGTESPYFKKWADGRQVFKVYHGTGDASFEAFKRRFGKDTTGDVFGTYFNTLGFYFAEGTEEEGAANTWAEGAMGSGKPAAIIPAYVALRNPFMGDPEQALTAMMEKSLLDLDRQTGYDKALSGIENPDDIAVLMRKFRGANAARVDAMLRKALQSQGYDGLVMQADSTSDERWVIAFDPTQIKSVFNRGTFDANDPRILMQPAGDVTQTPEFKKWSGGAPVVGRDARHQFKTGEAVVVEGSHGSPDARGLTGDDAQFKSQKERIGMGRDTGVHWFTPSKQTAKSYADPRRAFDYQNAEPGVIDAYVLMRNPLVIDGEGKNWRDAQKVGRTGDAIKTALEGGHDGLIVVNVKDDYNNGKKTKPTTTYAVFSPTQIKSVFNRGTFDANDPRILMQSAFHGSPYRFDKFSLGHLGSGEGAQAFGWGLYFAGAREVAQYYRDNLGASAFSYDGVQLEEGTPKRAAVELLWSWQGDKQGALDDAAGYDNARAIKNEIKKLDFGKIQQGGQLYEVDIPEDDVMLHWDKPLSEQPEKVRAALGFKLKKGKINPDGTDMGGGSILLDNRKRQADPSQIQPWVLKSGDSMFGLSQRDVDRMVGGQADATGSNIYTRLTAERGGQQEASEYLNSLGIKGIKYLDGTSRADGEGSYNYVIFDDSVIQILNTFYQDQASLRAMARGGMTPMADGTKLIELFAKANQSTLPHELAHAFLEEMRGMVERGMATDGVKSDLEKVETWLAGQIDRESSDWKAEYERRRGYGLDHAGASARADFVVGHELFARGFERYLMEGQAPTPELKGAFARFRKWLLDIYKDVKALRVELNPEIRSVFDRMLTAESEMETALTEAELRPMSETLMTALGMTPEDRQYVTRLFAEARSKAEEDMVADRNRGLRALRSEWFKAAKTTAEESPVHQMVTMLRKGRGLNRAEFLTKFGEEAAKGLPSKVLREDGLTLDEAALEHGHDTAEAMVNALWNYRKPADVAREFVEQKTAERDATFKAEDYIAGTKEFAAYMEIKSRYMKAGVVGAPAGKKPAVVARQVLQEYASRLIRRMPLRDAMRVDLFMSAMAKASRDEAKFAASGDWAKASKAADKARMNHAYSRESVRIRDEVDGVLALAKRLNKLKPGKIAEGHHKALLALIDRFALVDVDDSRYRDAPQLANLLKEGNIFGEDQSEAFASWLVDGTGRTDYRTLSAGEFEELKDLLKYLHGTGKDMLAPRLVAADILMADAEAQLVNQTAALPKRGKKLKEGSFLRKIQDAKDSFISQNRTLLWIVRELDGFLSIATGQAGFLERTFIDPLEEANRVKKELQQKVYGRMKGAYDVLLKAALKRPSKAALVDLPVPPAWQRQGRTWDYEACLSVFLNWGNEGNRQRIMQGNGLTEGDVHKILRLFSAEEAQAVQTVWDTLTEELWPHISKAHETLKYYTPGKVDPLPFTMPDGTQMKGGYYPLKYDASSDVRAARNEDATKALESPATGFTPKSVNSGSTKSRLSSAGGQPVLLRLGVLSNHIEWATQYASHVVVVHDLDRFFKRQNVAETIKDRVGQEAYQAVVEIVGRIANPRAGEVATSIDKLIGWANGAVATYAMWGNRLGAIQQVTALGNYVTAEGGVVEGTRTWMRGAAHFMSDPKGMWRWLIDNNSVMRDHFSFIKKTLAEAGVDDLKDISIGRGPASRKISNVREAVTRGGMAIYGMMDAVISAPGWYGSYLKGLDMGMTPQQAQDRATKILSEYTPMNREMDKTLLQQRKGLAVMWTFLSGFFAKNYNMISGYTKAWKQGAISTERFIGEVVAVRLLPPLITSIMYTLLRGDDDDKENIMANAAFDTIAYQFNGLPLVRDAAAYGVNVARAAVTGDKKSIQRNAFQLPGVQAVQLAQKLGATGLALAEDFGDDEKQMKAALALIEIAGFGAKIPAPKLVREILNGYDDMVEDEGSVFNLLIKPKIRRRD